MMQSCSCPCVCFCFCRRDRRLASSTLSLSFISLGICTAVSLLRSDHESFCLLFSCGRGHVVRLSRRPCERVGVQLFGYAEFVVLLSNDEEAMVCREGVLVVMVVVVVMSDPGMWSLGESLLGWASFPRVFSCSRILLLAYSLAFLLHY